jgi:predicted Fe-Mo cluster-binding NifX family protein
LEFEPIQNPNIDVGGGAGIQSAQIMADKDVSIVLTGNCGPNAFQTFGAAGIQVITGISGQVRQAVQQYKSGALNNTSVPSVQSHFGMAMGSGKGMGRGMGGGKGIGRGMGGGMGRGMGMGQDTRNAQPINEVLSSSQKPAGKKEEMAALKEQAEALKKQTEQVMARIKELEEKKE